MNIKSNLKASTKRTMALLNCLRLGWVTVLLWLSEVRRIRNPFEKTSIAIDMLMKNMEVAHWMQWKRA